MSMQPPPGAGALVLLRRLLPMEWPLSLSVEQGDLLTARVVAAAEGRATLLLRGLQVDARTNLSLREGDLLQLKAEEITRHRLVLRLVGPAEEPQPGPAPAAPQAGGAGNTAAVLLQVALALPLMAGGQTTTDAVITLDGDDPSRGVGGQGSALQVTVHWEGPALGPVQGRLRVPAVGPNGQERLQVRLAVTTAENRDLVLEHLGELGQALSALGWPGADLGCVIAPAALLRAERQAAVGPGARRLDLRG